MSLIVKLKELFGQQSPAVPRAKFYTWATDTISEFPYSGLNKFYREWRRDSLVRSCVNTLAFFAVNKGFETELDLTSPGNLSPEQVQRELGKPEWQKVKQKIDGVNAKVNLDWTLFTAIVKAKVYGKAGFEIVRNSNGLPERLIPLRSDDLKPFLDADWNLKSFQYKGIRDFYAPEDILYFANTQLEADHEGISEVESVFDTLQTRRTILQEAVKESARVLWSGIAILQVDTSKLTATDADKALTDVRDQIKPGKHVVVNKKVTPQIVNLEPQLERLTNVLEYLDADIIGNFKVPRFLIGREKQFNRATAFAEAQLFIEGPITDIQRWVRRTLEAQWYERLVRTILELGTEETSPITVKHRWNPVTISDFAELVDVAATLQSSQLVKPEFIVEKILGLDQSATRFPEERPASSS